MFFHHCERPLFTPIKYNGASHPIYPSSYTVIDTMTYEHVINLLHVLAFLGHFREVFDKEKMQ
jgi:hypothetical protein